MQMKKILLLAAAAAANAASTESLAQRWLLKHQGNPDELSDLKDQNPDAYALVKALLTKRSLGLLHSRHPTASFAAAPPQEQAHGAGSQNWMNWKPKDSATDDESMVKSVLGAVSSLAQSKGLSIKLPAAHSDNVLENEAASLGVSDVFATTPAPHNRSDVFAAEELQQRETLSWHDDSVVVPAVPTMRLPEFSTHVASSWSEPAPVLHHTPLAYSEDEEARQRAALAGAGASVVSSSAPSRQSNGGGWMNWKPKTGADDEQMVNSVLGAVAGLRKPSQGQAAFLRKEAAPSSNALLNDAADMDIAGVQNTPDTEPVVHSGPSAEEQQQRLALAGKVDSHSAPIASLASLSTPLVMHHHMSHFWSEEKSAPQPSASPIVDQPAASSTWQRFGSPLADDKPKPLAVEHEQSHVGKSATDKMVDSLLGVVANMATGKNREILLRKKAHIAGSAVDSNPLVDAAETLGVQPMEVASNPAQAASSMLSSEEAQERTASGWHDDGPYTPPMASTLSAAHHVTGTWAAGARPATLGDMSAEAPVARETTARHADASLWNTIGRTAQMFGVKTEASAQAVPQPENSAQPAPPAHHSLMAEFLKHSHNAIRRGHSGQETKKASASESLLKDQAVLSNDDGNEADTAHAVVQAQVQVALKKVSVSWEDASEARLAARAASRKAKPEALAEPHSSSPLDAFSFEDTSPAPKRSAAASPGDLSISHNLASWLGFSSHVTRAQAPSQAQRVKHSLGNNYMDDLMR